jgi:V8-like Glu-specific endopeptidase
MSKKLMVLLALIFAVTSCTRVPQRPETTFPTKLIEQTVSLVSYDEMHSVWGTYCTGVWVDSRHIVTAYHCAVAAKVMSLPEDQQEDADNEGQKLDAIGAPIFYSTKDSFNNVIHNGPMNYLSAKVVGGDGPHDLALIEVNGSPLAHRSATFAEFEPAVGDDIEVMGHPGGVEYTYARGYVSAYRSDIDQDAIDIHGPFMQINAGISGGNSGGGVFNSRGQLVGIISFVNSRIAVQGFAVPMGSIKRFLEEYNKKKKAASTDTK